MERKIKDSKFLLPAICCLLLVIGFSLSFLWRPEIIKTDEIKSKHQGGYTYISPLLECANSESNLSETKELEKKMKSFINKEKEKNNVEDIALYFHDLTNDNWIGINQSTEFSPASLLKVPLMIAYLKLAETDPSILQNKITVPIINSNSSIQNILPTNSVKIGQEYTIEQLIEYSISYSDNQATDTLLLYMDSEFLNQIYSDLGLKELPTKAGIENFMSVREYASFFEILYNASYLSKEMSEYALEILTKSIFKEGLVNGLAENTLIAHKFGERIFSNNRQLHDCGIVYTENSPYLICIMTRQDVDSGEDFSGLESIIQELSKLAYSHITM